MCICCRAHSFLASDFCALLGCAVMMPVVAAVAMGTEFRSNLRRSNAILDTEWDEWTILEDSSDEQPETQPTTSLVPPPPQAPKRCPVSEMPPPPQVPQRRPASEMPPPTQVPKRHRSRSRHATVTWLLLFKGKEPYTRCSQSPCKVSKIVKVSVVEERSCNAEKAQMNRLPMSQQFCCLYFILLFTLNL